MAGITSSLQCRLMAGAGWLSALRTCMTVAILSLKGHWTIINICLLLDFL